MNVSNLKMKELAEVEKLSGLTMSEWSEPTAKLTMAIAYVIGKKTNAKLTWEDVENMTIEEMTKIAEDTEVPKAKSS
jgi:hypothetical protein